MFAALIVAAALGQINASDGPPRSWVLGTVNGRAAWVWGWNESGWVKFHKHENHHLYPEYKPVAPAKKPDIPVAPGMVLESNGTLNSGLHLEQARRTESGGFDTNDAGLLKKLKLDADCPDSEPDPIPTPPPAEGVQPYVLPGALVLGALILAVAVTRSTK